MAAQASLCLAWSETPEDTFCCVVAQIKCPQKIAANKFLYDDNNQSDTLYSFSHSLKYEDQTLHRYQMSHITRKFVLWHMQTTKKTQISLCVAQSDLRICCSLPIDSMILHLISRNSKTLASFSNWANRFETNLVANPECAVRTAKNLVWGSGLSLRCSHTHSSIYVISTLSARAGSYMLSVSFHKLIWLNCWHVTLYKKGHRL